MAKQKQIITIADQKLANRIVQAADKAASTYGQMAALTQEFVLNGRAQVTKAEFLERCKVLYATDAYKASQQQAAIRKAIQRMRHDAYGKENNGNTGVAKTKTSAAKAKVITKTVEKIVRPSWADNLPELVENWCAAHPVQVLAVLREAYERDLRAIKVA